MNGPQFERWLLTTAAGQRQLEKMIARGQISPKILAKLRKEKKP